MVFATGRPTVLAGATLSDAAATRADLTRVCPGWDVALSPSQFNWFTIGRFRRLPGPPCPAFSQESKNIAADGSAAKIMFCQCIYSKSLANLWKEA